MSALDPASGPVRWRAGRSTLQSVARYLRVEVDAPTEPTARLAVPSIFLAPRAPRDVYVP